MKDDSIAVPASRAVKQLTMLYEMIKLLEDESAGQCWYELAVWMIATPQGTKPEEAIDAFLRAWDMNMALFDF